MGSRGRTHKAFSEPSRIFKGSDKIQEIDGIIELFVTEGNAPNRGASEKKSKCAENLRVPQDISENESTERSELGNDHKVCRISTYHGFFYLFANALTLLTSRGGVESSTLQYVLHVVTLCDFQGDAIKDVLACLALPTTCHGLRKPKGQWKGQVQVFHSSGSSKGLENRQFLRGLQPSHISRQSSHERLQVRTAS